MASSRGFLNIQSLNELTYENSLSARRVVQRGRTVSRSGKNQYSFGDGLQKRLRRERFGRLELGRKWQDASCLAKWRGWRAPLCRLASWTP